MDKHMNTPQEEHQREIELIDAGFDLNWFVCPNCGALLWEKSEAVGQDEDDGEEMYKLTQECAACGHGAVSYDG